MLGQGPPLAELDRAHRRVLDLDEEGGGELAGPAEELVVGVDLVLDVGLAHDLLGAHHLLDLVPHGERVLE